jgi:Zn-finger protein
LEEAAGCNICHCPQLPILILRGDKYIIDNDFTYAKRRH